VLYSTNATLALDSASYEVLTAVLFQNPVFWDATLCRGVAPDVLKSPDVSKSPNV
jgi:hypothetical protein